MSYNNQLAGPLDASQYAVSGYPFVTQSSVTNAPITINFPQITKFFTVQVLTSGSIDVAFTANGFDSGHYFRLQNSGSFAADLRVPALHLSASTAGTEVVQIVAGLTGVPAGLMTVTGSDGQVGVG